VRILEIIDFSIQEVHSLPKTKEFVGLQAGRGKKDHSIIQVSSKGFSYVEGLIWNKYREYGNKLKSKISSSEWERILKGFNTALQQLSEYETEDELIKILKFEIMNSKNSLIVALENIDELEGFLSKMIDWISSMIVDEDYILIMKKK